jgi:uncharacterized protein YbaA (DUF1428 family)
VKRPGSFSGELLEFVAPQPKMTIPGEKVAHRLPVQDLLTQAWRTRKMNYVDGFVLAVPKKNLDNYRRLSKAAGKVWRDHGALQYVEAVGDDLKVKFGVSFEKIIKVKKGETVIFSWIVYKSRKHRDQVNAKVMADPRLETMMEKMPMPFDVKRMVYGGFKFLVDV